MTEAERLREQRAAKAKRAGELLAVARTEDRDLSTDEQTEWDTLHTEAEALKGKIDQEERQATLEAELRVSTGRVGGQATEVTEGGDTRTAAERDKEYSRAFEAYVRYGFGSLNSEARSLLQGGWKDLDLEAVQNQAPEELRDMLENRALSSIIDPAGGYTVPDDAMQPIVQALKDFSGVRQSRATVLTTSTGRQIPIPTGDDTINEGEQVGENQEVDEEDVVFGQKVLDAYTYSSKMVRVPFQLLQDSSVDLDSYLGRLLGERLGRIMNKKDTIGTGTNEPNGIVTAATLGDTTAAATAITRNEMIDLKHSVDPAYRIRPEWMWHDNILKYLKQLLDGEGRPLWQAGVAGGTPDTFDGDPYTINQNMASQVVADAKAVLYGDMSYFYLRDVSGMMLLRLNERFAEFGQVAFLAFWRHDSELMDAGTHPIKYLQQAP